GEGPNQWKNKPSGGAVMVGQPAGEEPGRGEVQNRTKPAGWCPSRTKCRRSSSNSCGDEGTRRRGRNAQIIRADTRSKRRSSTSSARRGRVPRPAGLTLQLARSASTSECPTTEQRPGRRAVTRPSPPCSSACRCDPAG